MGCTLAKRECLNKAASVSEKARRSLHAPACVCMLFAFVNGSQIWKKLKDLWSSCSSSRDNLHSNTPPASTGAAKKVSSHRWNAASGPPPTNPPLGLRRRAPIKNDPGEIYFARPNRYKADVNGGDNTAGGTFIHAAEPRLQRKHSFSIMMTLWYVYLAIMTHVQIIYVYGSWKLSP